MTRTSLARWAAGCAVALIAATLAACGSSGTSSAGGTGTGGQTSPASNLTKSPVVIGNIGGYSGTTFATEYKRTLFGLQAWVQWTNEHGGLAGHPVKLVSYDDQNDPAKSLQFVKRMVENDHVVAILAPVAQGTDNAWANYVKEKKVPVIGGVSLDGNWLDNPYMLATNVTIMGYLTSQIGAAKTLGNKVGELVCVEQAACKEGISTFEGIVKKLGLGWAGAQAVAGNATNYIAQCAAMKDAHADVIVPETSATTMVSVVKSCSEQGYHPAIVVPAGNIDQSVVSDPAFEGALGVNVSPLWFGDSPLTKDWKQAYAAAFPDDTAGGHSTLGWQAGVVFGKALQNAPDVVTSDTVMQGLYAQPAGSDYGGWTPPLTFTPGKATDVKPCMWYVQIKAGKLVAPRGDKYVCVS
ncbi:MAG TPA: ABC transporter substrate-binding protein [Mycobacteriales bacterium]|jgi:branched-chain amino acid transport system substrate-binding protein|nr:ABC transporter substrate-binding protein [Mycobacteriales bacterium]